MVAPRAGSGKGSANGRPKRQLRQLNTLCLWHKLALLFRQFYTKNFILTTIMCLIYNVTNVITSTIIVYCELLNEFIFI